MNDKNKLIKDKIIYIRNFENIEDESTEVSMAGEPTRLEYEVSTDMNIWEFKQLIRRLAFALGYGPSCVLGAFPITKEEDMSFEQRLEEMNDMDDGYDYTAFREIFKTKEIGSVDTGITLHSDFENIIEAEIKRILEWNTTGSMDDTETNDEVE